MCRMIVAAGRVNVPAVLRAAWGMSAGHTADHDGPITRHPNGWGAAWREPTGLGLYRSAEPMPESADGFPHPPPETDFLTVHVRHATRPTTNGVRFTHPVTAASGGVPWLLFHNGYTPTAYRPLGRADSEFDTAELLDYLRPAAGDTLDRATLIARLNRLEPGGTAANAVFINPARAYVLQWAFAPIRYPRYFTLWRHRGPQVTYVSSERIHDLAPAAAWEPLAQGDLIEFPFPVLPLTHLED